MRKKKEKRKIKEGYISYQILVATNYLGILNQQCLSHLFRKIAHLVEARRLHSVKYTELKYTAVHVRWSLLLVQRLYCEEMA